MFNIYAKTKFAQLGNQLLRVGFFMVGALLFSYSNADSVPTGEPINESKIENPYFMDFDSLQEHLSADWHSGDLVYEQKDDPETIWIFLPITNLMLAHYRTVAAVLAPALQKKLDASAAVPLTKFVVQRQADGQGYKLLGCAYQELFDTDSFSEIRRERGFKYYAQYVIYTDHKIERDVVIWDYLGMPSPRDFLLEMSRDDKFVRYDYDNAFQRRIPTFFEADCCSTYLPIRDYQCDPIYIKNFKQELYERHKTTLQEVISEISVATNQYLKGRDLIEINKAFEAIIRDYGS